MARAPLLLATVFASGAAVMIVEMTAVRAVQPFFGSTTYVWTNVIAVVLAALAVGYAIGGRLADRWPSHRLLYGLLGAGGLLVALSALLVTPVSLLFLADGVDLEGVVSVLLWGSLGTGLLVFAPPILLLGTIGPIAIRLLARRGVGRAAGAVFALSTAGSIVGTYLPALVLVPRLGSRGSILVAAGILLVASAVGLLVCGRRRAKVGAWIVLLGGASAFGAAGAQLVTPSRPVPLWPDGVSTLIAETESPYQYLTVRDDVWTDGAERVLTINEGLYTHHAFQAPGRVLTGSRFYDAYTVLPLLLDLERDDELRLCVVGMACGVNAAQWHHFFGDHYSLQVDGAELDPTIVQLGRRYFGMPTAGSPWLRVFTMDGRSLLELGPPETRYHAIVVDAFANELYVPFHLSTREFFEVCRSRLVDGGIVAMNVHAHRADAPNLSAIEDTLASVFSSVLRVPHYETGGFLLLARRGPEAPDLSLLDPAVVRRRFPDRNETPEWSALLSLARSVRRTAVQSGHTITPRPGARILTDDHAPLEWLTDRFLWDAEAERVEAGDTRSRDLGHLRDRQARLLALIALGWGVVLLGLALGTRARAT